MGSPLSTVQVKLLVIARAILQKPKLLIIDGLLDEIDEYSLKFALEVLLNLHDCTVLVMTRSSNIAGYFPRAIAWQDLNAENKQ